MFSTQLDEITIPNVKVEGSVPSWISGHLICNGPAQFEVGKTTFNHWIDGFAMLKKFSFNSGNISFQNKFLRSQQYVLSTVNKQLSRNEFGTSARSSLTGIASFAIQNLLDENVYDNCNVNTIKLGRHYVAITESNTAIEFDPITLETVEGYSQSEKTLGQLSVAHPQTDVTTGEIVNVTIEIGKKIKYHIYKIFNGNKVEKIKTYVSDSLFYIHSFSLTRNYIILFKSSLEVDTFKLLSKVPFIQTMSVSKNSSTIFLIIDRRTGKIKEKEVDPFICLHSVNASETKNELVLDLICYNENPYEYYYLANLKAEQPKFPLSYLQRYVINVKSAKSKYFTLLNNHPEFPSINPKNHGSTYKFAYTNFISDIGQKYFNGVQKINVTSGESTQWQKSGYYLSEPIFVPNKQRQRHEDDGILFLIAFKAATQNSALIILDANSMQQIGEGMLPIRLPMGLHGNFYPS